MLTTLKEEPCKGKDRRVASKSSMFSAAPTTATASRVSTTTSLMSVDALQDGVLLDPDTALGSDTPIAGSFTTSSMDTQGLTEQKDCKIQLPQGEAQSGFRRKAHNFGAAQLPQPSTNGMISVLDVHNAICEVSTITQVAYVCSQEKAQLVSPLSSMVTFSNADPCEFPERLARAAAAIFIVEDSEDCVGRAGEILRSESGSMTGPVSVLLMGLESTDFGCVTSKISDLMEAGADDVAVVPRGSSQLQCFISVALVKAKVCMKQKDYLQKKLAASRKQCHRLFWQVSHEVLQGMPEVRENLREVYGESIGNIDIISKVGRGSSCEVFKCHHGTKDKTCVVKVFKKHEIKSLDRLSQVVIEHKTLKMLKHPNIAEGINLVHGLQNVYLFMEMVGTTNLFQMIKLEGENGLLWPKAKELLLHIFHGVAYMHGMEVAHCDLKPENIMISPAGGAKLIDFGQAILLDDIPDLENPRGTMPFMAPEMMYVSTPFDPVATDLWSLGVIMVEMLCGNHMYAQILGWKSSSNSLAELRQCADELLIVFAKQSKDGLLQGIIDLFRSEPPPCVRAMLAGLLELDPASRLPAKHMVGCLEENM